jgi:hypothetical protein
MAGRWKADAAGVMVLPSGGYCAGGSTREPHGRSGPGGRPGGQWAAMRREGVMHGFWKDRVLGARVGRDEPAFDDGQVRGVGACQVSHVATRR